MLIKEKLARGEVVTMINPDHPSPSLIEFLGGLGFDAVFIDCEHGMAGPERVQEMCRAARVSNTAPIIRPEANRDWLITRYLDAGCAGVMVPHIDTADAARQLVSAVRHAKPFDHASKLVIAMVESQIALDNLNEILDIEGVDVFFVGPGDLSNSLGMPGQRFSPQVQDMVFAAGEKIVSRGKVAGTLVKKDNASLYVKQGFRYLYEHANALLADGAQQFRLMSQKDV